MDWLKSAVKSSLKSTIAPIFQGGNAKSNDQPNAADAQGALESSADFARGGAQATPDHFGELGRNIVVRDFEGEAGTH